MNLSVGFKEWAQRHIRSRFFPPTPPTKAGNALRFGIMSGGSVAPEVLIDPARLHPEVVVAAVVAATNSARAERFAKEHGIPRVLTSFDELINDPTIDAVYIGAGMDAQRLFHSFPILRPDGPVFLEAIPYRFHPSWIEFQRRIDKYRVSEVRVTVMTPVASNAAPGNARFMAEQSGSARMGPAYAFSILQGIFGFGVPRCEQWNVSQSPP
ncbi:uncharacterized protein B0T15DRAFT_495963 [Chaetomium strumarium]|uniref:D-xylose 1-dehydrogenase (NADP(+), D-xylono-1,5-lactone-forming) n=1 Tax=Chaetomium strumarium TaxID=1170767 RepID=A0AAJ0LZG0_9PEZI|nr:hypothetical protein B0T15DRAFT_495963 [Chaetomium strumarium]